MNHLKERLSDYREQAKNLTKNHQMILASDVLDMVEQLIDDLEEDEKENEWILCSERLPENETNVIASFSDGTVTELRHVANGIFHGIYEYSTKVIVAWKPLPEPYKEE